MMVSMPLSIQAKVAALIAHERVGQTRKYGSMHYGKERYYFHACRVAELVATVTSDEHVIAAAALHDVLEDVTPKQPDISPKLMLDTFGPKVLFYVMECTNVYSKDVKQRQVLLDTIDVLHALDMSIPVPENKSRLQLDELRKQVEAAFLVADKANREERKRLEAERYAHISDQAKIIKRADLFDNSLSMDGAPADFVERWMAEKALTESLIGSWLDYEKKIRDERAAKKELVSS